MEVSFYEMAVKIVGTIPETLYWLYDFTTLCLIICSFMVFIIPISIIFKRFCR